MPTLSLGQYQLVHNFFSLAVAAMLGSFIFFVIGRGQVTAKYRPALVMSSLVVAIAGYHYFRIYNSWHDAYTLTGGSYVASGTPFNDAYRYVDWLLTVPLLVAELVAVLTLAKGVRGPMMAKLMVASVFMIALGYPGEVSTDIVTRAVWAAASTVPFCYILYVLWFELAKAAVIETEEVRVLLRNARLLILGTWGFYPIAFLMPMIGIGGANAQVALQVGYTIADIAAKCGYGVLIYQIARAKMAAEGTTEDPALALA